MFARPDYFFGPCSEDFPFEPEASADRPCPRSLEPPEPPSEVGAASVVDVVVLEVLAVVPPTENETDNVPVLPIQSRDVNVAVCEPGDADHESDSWQMYVTLSHVVVVTNAPSMERSIVLTAWSSLEETVMLIVRPSTT